MALNTQEGQHDELRKSETPMFRFSFSTQRPNKAAENGIQKVFGSFQETFFVAHLSKLLINDPKLEIVAYDMFIEGNNKSGSLKIRMF